MVRNSNLYYRNPDNAIGWKKGNKSILSEKCRGEDINKCIEEGTYNLSEIVINTELGFDSQTSLMDEQVCRNKCT